MSERSNTDIRSWEEHIQEPYQKGSTLTSDHGRNTSKNHVRKAQHSHPIMGGTHPRTILERLGTYILPWDEHINHVRMDQHLYITMRWTHHHEIRAQHLYLTMGWTHQPCQKGSTLISDHGMNTSTMSEGLYTYIWSCGMNTSHSHIKMALHLHLIMWEHIPQSHQNGSYTYIWPWKEPILSPCQNGSQTHHFPLEAHLNMENTKLLPEVLKLHPSH